MRILAGWCGCGGLSRSVPCCWAPSPWPCPRSPRTTTSCASSSGSNRPGQRRVHRAGAGHRGRRRRCGRPHRDRLTGRRADQHGSHHQGDPGQPGPGHHLRRAGGGAGRQRRHLHHPGGDVAAMAPSTNIGAASVVGSGGADCRTPLADKINNSTRPRSRSWPRPQPKHGVGGGGGAGCGQRLRCEAVAMDPPVVDMMATDVDDLFAQIDNGQRADGQPYDFNGEPLPPLSGLPVQDVNMSLGQPFLHLLSDPNIAFILFTIGFYGIVSELFHPNFFQGPVGVLRWCWPSSAPTACRSTWRAAADPDRHRALHPRAARHLVRPPDDGWGDLLRAGRLRPVDRRRPEQTRSSLDQPWLLASWWPSRWPTCTASCAR